MNRDEFIKCAFLGGLAGDILKWRLRRIIGAPSMWTALTRAAHDVKLLPKALAWHQTMPDLKLDMMSMGDGATATGVGFGDPQTTTFS